MLGHVGLMTMHGSMLDRRVCLPVQRQAQREVDITLDLNYRLRLGSEVP